MKARLFLVSMLALLPVVSTLATENLKKASKEITHTLGKVKRGDKLEISNKFGNIDFRFHSKKEIHVLVDVKVSATNDMAAKRLLNKVEVVADTRKNSSGTVYTLRNNYDGETKAMKLEAHWVVYIPEDMLCIKVENKFGNVVIEDYSMPFDAEVTFGNLIAGRLSYDGRISASVNFGKLHVDEAVDMDVELGFSKMLIYNIERLNITSKHSSLRVGTAGSVVASLEHTEEFTIESVNDLRIDELSFSTMRIDNLIRRLSVLEGSHSNVSAMVLSAKKFETINMDVEHTPIRLFLPHDINAYGRLYSKMGTVNVNQSLSKRPVYKKKELYEGYFGNLSKPTARIDITDSFSKIIIETFDYAE